MVLDCRYWVYFGVLSLKMHCVWTVVKDFLPSVRVTKSYQIDMSGWVFRSSHKLNRHKLVIGVAINSHLFAGPPRKKCKKIDSWHPQVSNGVVSSSFKTCFPLANSAGRATNPRRAFSSSSASSSSSSSRVPCPAMRLQIGAREPYRAPCKRR